MLLEVFTVFESPVMRGEGGREGGGREGGEGEVAIPFGGALETSIQHLRTKKWLLHSFSRLRAVASLEPCGVRMKDMN